MIAEAAQSIAAAIAAALGEAVTVTPYKPETAAPPCVWLELASVLYGDTGWSITFDAHVVADAGRAAAPAAAELAGMVDAVLKITAPGVAPRAMVARGGETARTGETTNPAVIVTISQVTPIC